MASSDRAAEKTLRVSGTGAAESDADRCVLHVRLRATADATGNAVTQLSRLVTEVLAALEEEGVPTDAIRTTDVTVGDRRDDPRDRVTGRMASYVLRIDVPGLDRAGTVLSRLASVAGDSLDVQGFEMALGDPRALLGEARRRAVEDARTKADELAAAVGVTLGEVLSIEEEPSRGERPRRIAATALALTKAPVPPVPIEGGPLSVTVAVTLVYRIS